MRNLFRCSSMRRLSSSKNHKLKCDNIESDVEIEYMCCSFVDYAKHNIMMQFNDPKIKCAFVSQLGSLFLFLCCVFLSLKIRSLLSVCSPPLLFVFRLYILSDSGEFFCTANLVLPFYFSCLICWKSYQTTIIFVINCFLSRFL